jgi:hypothetical protein
MNEDSVAFLRAIKGPVMLITVGVLFALDNFTPFSFDRTWPVLLVIAGILSLGRGPRLHGRLRYQAKWGPPRPFGPPVPPPPAPPPPRPPDPQPSGASAAPPGTYRGSAYEATPGGSGPRGSESREKPSERPADPGATQ